MIKKFVLTDCVILLIKNKKIIQINVLKYNIKILFF
jgi:hypothetical protein